MALSASSTIALRRWRFSRCKPYLYTVGIVVICSLLGWCTSLLGLTSANILMIFLAGVTLVAARFGHWPAVLAAVLSVLIFDYFFVSPILSFAPTDAQYLFVDLAALLGIGLLVSELTARLQLQLQAARHQERTTAQLYRMTRELSESAGVEFLLTTAARQLADIFSGEVVVFSADATGQLSSQYGHLSELLNGSSSIDIANWVASNGKIAGAGTDRFSDVAALFVPLIGSSRTLGVLGIQPGGSVSFADSEQRRLLQTCASLIALSIERDQSFLAAQEAQLQVQSEQFRNYVLSSVSHDLRTPLAMIAVTASNLLEESTESTWASKRAMLRTIVDESHRLTRQMENLLRHARLTIGPIVLNREWQVLEELVGIALTRLQSELADRTVRIEIERDFPLLWVAGDLIGQVLVNLLENAIRYTPPGSEIEIFATHSSDFVELRIADRGPGFPPENQSKLFEKFFRGTQIADGQLGIGLGLAICKAIVEAHEGQIRAANRLGGGAEFTITLPCPQRSVQATLEESQSNSAS